MLYKNERLRKYYLLMLGILVSLRGYSQFDMPDPDAPPSAPAVPFDDHLHIIIIVAGALFGLYIVTRRARQSPAGR